MKPLFLFIFNLSLCCSFGQNFQLIDTSDYKQRESLIKFFETKNSIFNNNIKQSYKGELRNEVLQFYKQSQENIIEIVESKKLLFDSKFQNYIDSLYNKLKSSNTELENENIKLYVSKDTSPNAISTGDGSIILNIGLFNFLENEHQLLAVMSHEVGHQLLKHTHKSIEKRANINTTVLSNKSLTSRTIRIEKYNRGTKSFNLLKNLLYEEGEARRRQEVEADSIGYVLYKNTNFNKSEYINSLALLKKYDSVPSVTIESSSYHKIFNLAEQNFKDSWLENEDFKGYNYDLYKAKFNLDSLKEHPDIDIRINKLQSAFSDLKNEAKLDITMDTAFKDLKQIANKAYVENLYYLNEYGLSIYLIMNRLEDDFDDAYYKKWLGINFNAIFEAKKKYQMNRYVDRLVPNEQSESYQTFLNFIWNLSLNEIKIIADHYNKT